MSRLIHMDLTIDRAWDPDGVLARVFPLRLPAAELAARSNETLGLFEAGEGDLVVTPPLGAGLSEHLAALGARPDRALEIASHPKDAEAFASEVIAKVGARARRRGEAPQALLAAGRSPVGERLGRALGLSLEGLPRSEWNRKTFLLELAREGRLEIPATSTLTTPELLDWKPERAVYLKFEWGSGGGANFPIAPDRLAALQYLKGRLATATAGVWLVQNEVDARSEGAVFGFVTAAGGTPRTAGEKEAATAPGTVKPGAEAGTAAVARVKYDGNGLSYLHEREPDPEVRERALAAFANAAAALAARGYDGPLGLDYLVTRDGRLLCNDLNARWTKSHLIRSAARRLGLDPEAARSIRRRWKTPRPWSFPALWVEVRRALDVDARGRGREGARLVPYLASGFGDAAGPWKEICFFLEGDGSFEKRLEAKWNEIQNRNS